MNINIYRKFIIIVFYWNYEIVIRNWIEKKMHLAQGYLSINKNDNLLILCHAITITILHSWKFDTEPQIHFQRVYSLNTSSKKIGWTESKGERRAGAHAIISFIDNIERFLFICWARAIELSAIIGYLWVCVWVWFWNSGCLPNRSVRERLYFIDGHLWVLKRNAFQMEFNHFPSQWASR